MRNWWIAIAIFGMAFAGVCAAQGSTEATRWLIAKQGPNQLSEVFVSVYNVGVGPARTAVLVFKSGRVIAPPAPVRVIAIGNMIETRIAVPFDFILVVADSPVIVTGDAWRVTQSTQGQSGQILGTMSNGGNGDFRGYMQPFNYMYTHPVVALPIDCNNTPAAHFACGMTFAGNSSASPADDVRVRPDERRGQAARPADRIQ